MQIKMTEVKDLYDQGYVWLKTDKGYDPEKQNSIKDHFKISTKVAQDLKRSEVVKAFLKTRTNEVELVP